MRPKFWLSQLLTFTKPIPIAVGKTSKAQVQRGIQGHVCLGFHHAYALSQKIMAPFGKHFDVNAIAISKWRGEALENLSMAFKSGHSSAESEASI